MSFIDWQGANEAATAYNAETTAAQQQLQQSQQLRALSALRGIDLSNPDSLHQGINALAGLGMFEQAKAASDLYRTSAINQAVTPLVQEAVGNARQGMEQPSDQGQMDTEKHERLLTEANAALSDIMSTEDQQQRQQKAQAWKTHFANEGVPEDAIDGVIGDLSDQGLQGHQANIQRELTQYQPGYQQSKSALNSGLANPIVMGALGGAGVDVAPGLTLAANITSPVRGEQAQLAFAPGIASATTTATNIANLNSLPAVQFAANRAAAQGTAAGTLDTITLDDGSKIQAVLNYDENGHPYYVRLGSPPAGGAAPPAQTGVTGAGPARGPGVAEAGPGTPSPQTQATLTASGQQLAADRTAASNSTAQLASLKDIDRLAPTTNTGPGTTVTNGWRSFLIAQAPWLAQHLPGFDLNAQQIQTADQNEIKKDMLRVATMAGDAVGGQGTDYRMAQAISGNANIDMTQLSVRQINRMTMGLMRALYAKAPAFDATHQQGQEGQYSKWAENYGLTVDPRAFILDVLTPAERKAITDTLGKPGSTAWQHFSNGVMAAQKAGYYNVNNLPMQ